MHVVSLYAVCVVEQRLLLRRPGFWIHPAFMALLGFFIVASATEREHTFDILVRLINNVAFFQLPLMAWVATPAIVRHNTPTRDWFWVTRNESPIVLLGQFVTLFLAFFLSSIAALAVATIAMIVQDSLTPAMIAEFWGYALVILAPITFFELGCVFALGLCLQRTLVTAVVTIVFYALLVLGVAMPYATLLSPLNFTLLRLRIDPLIGLGADRTLVVTLLWLYVSLTVSVLALVIWITSRVDMRRGWRRGHHWIVSLPLVLGIISTSFASFTYAGVVTRSKVPPPVLDQVDIWHVTHAEHIGIINQPNLEVTSRLQLMYTGATPVTSVVLALNPWLEVTQAQIDGTTVNVTREGEVVRMAPGTVKIMPQQIITVTLAYQGRPRILREDYSHANSLGREEPTRFIRPVRTYLDHRQIMLERDGDWRVWPQVSTLYIAQQNQVQITVIDSSTIISSGEVVQRRNGRVTYAWNEKVPQLLIAVAPYHVVQTDYGMVYLAPKGSLHDQKRAIDLLRLRRIAATVLNEPPRDYAVAIMPYTSDIIVGASVIGMPPITAFAPLRMIESTYQDARWTQAVLALDLVQGLLAERISWSMQPLNTIGQPVSVSINCTFDAEEKAICERQIRGEHSPQAPQGRLVRPRIASPLLHAWSVVIGRRVARDQLDPNTLAEERHLWKTLSKEPNSTNFNARNDARNLLSNRGLLPDFNLDEDAQAQQIAALVTQIDHIQEQQGDAGLSDLLDRIASEYPAGGKPLTEEAFQSFVQKISQ